MDTHISKIIQSNFRLGCLGLVVLIVAIIATVAIIPEKNERVVVYLNNYDASIQLQNYKKLCEEYEEMFYVLWINNPGYVERTLSLSRDSINIRFKSTQDSLRYIRNLKLEPDIIPMKALKPE